MENFKWREAAQSVIVIFTCLSCLAFFMLGFIALIVYSRPGLVYYGIGLIASGVALKLEMDIWLR